jgi:hypothetical protein
MSHRCKTLVGLEVQMGYSARLDNRMSVRGADFQSEVPSDILFFKSKRSTQSRSGKNTLV